MSVLNEKIDSLFEADLATLAHRQKTITQLFPKFYPRVKAVFSKGGVRFIGMDKDGWHFKVASGTKSGVQYDVDVKFIDTPKALAELAKDGQYWEGGKLSLEKMAIRLMRMDKFQVKCSDPSDLYWGFHFIRSQGDLDAMIPPPEDRAPDVRNPGRKGSNCKHIQALLGVLPMYGFTFVKWLKKYYGDVIRMIERDQRKKDALPIAPKAPKSPMVPKEPKAPVAPRLPIPPKENV